MRLCFLAPSGYGKSTASKYLESKMRFKNIKIGEPLYELESMFYDYIHTSMKGEQDGELLQFLGMKIRRENPMFLLNTFLEKIEMYEQDYTIINDDARPQDYEFLKSLGFVFIKINGFKRDRIDHTKSDDKSSLEWQSDIPCDYELDNFGLVEDYFKNIDSLMEVIKREQKVLYYTDRKVM